jgi:hydroxyacylglutathione hydrolase
MRIPLEDTYADVTGKAARGLGLDPIQLAAKRGFTRDAAVAFLEGRFDEGLAHAIAGDLGLCPQRLAALARGDYAPRPDPGIPGLRAFNTPFGDMTVNSYLLWDPESRLAAFIDTGADCDPALGILRAENLTPVAILLTHAHGDHVIELDRLVEKTGAEAWIGENEPLDGACPFPDGKLFHLGALEISTRPTPGHSPGAISYVVQGLQTPVAFVGDALFAGSMGGPNISHAEGIASVQSQIFTLPDHTILCPGHGPTTTVAEEKLHNPFFPARRSLS